MGENEFEGLFSADEIAELKAAAEAAESTVAKPAGSAKKDGVWYVETQGDISTYAVNAGGKTLLWITVDNANHVDIGMHLPGDATAHVIRVWNATHTAFLDTKGFALRYTHNDGSGLHIDGNTIRSYIGQRVGHFLGHFYGV